MMEQPKPNLVEDLTIKAEAPTTIEEYRNQYLYLADDFLSRPIDFCIETTSLKKVAIQLVLFSLDISCKYTEYNKTIKTETPLPFLKFAGFIQNSQFQFPEFVYECLTENNETHFQNQILEKLLSTYGVQPTASLDFDLFYRGYLPYQPSDSSDTIIYVAIDYNEFMKQMTQPLTQPLTQPQPQPQTQPIWAIVDELVFKKKVLEAQVDKKITEMMDRHPYMWNIIYNGDYMEYFPFSLYLVITNDEQTYESNSLPRTKTRESTTTIGRKIDNYSLVEEYGDRYCFTNAPLSIMENIVRYAVFTPKPKYILDNVVGGSITEDIYDNMPDSDKEVLEETLSENIAHSVIYFTEKTGNLTGKHIWGIKTHELFSIV